jgi:hypothetical protein
MILNGQVKTWQQPLNHCLGYRWHVEIAALSLALAHAKSGDAAMIAGYVGKREALDDAMTQCALA